MKFDNRFLLFSASMLLTASSAVAAHDAEMARHFDYDRTARLNIAVPNLYRRPQPN
jgi:hypothetical protein